MIKFGTGGWRAIIGDEFIKSNIEIIAQAIATDINSNPLYVKEVIIGYDRRFLSRESAEWIMSVLAGNNIKSYFVEGGTPTPAIMHKMKNMDIDYGIAVTASHNPALYNGLKIFVRGGRDCSLEVSAKLEELFYKDEILRLNIDKARNEGLIETINPKNDYLDSIMKFVDYEAIKAADLKVAFDPMYGSSTDYLKDLLSILRCEHHSIHTYHDTLYGKKTPSPTQESMLELSTLVRQGHYEIGFSSDGDGDRLAMIDESGKYISSNEMLMLLYHYLLTIKKNSGNAVRNVSTTHMLDRIAEHNNQKCIEVPVGFKHISEGMEKYDCILGGESSGGLAIKGHIEGKDGMFAIAIVLEMLAVTGKKISTLLEEIYSTYGRLYYKEHNLQLLSEESKEHYQNIFYVEKLIPNFKNKIKEISYLDGLKITFENGGWITIRFSGTEPLFRFNVEMPSNEEVQETLDSVLDFIKEYN